MPSSYRFDRDLDRLLTQAASVTGKSRSQLVREAVASYSTKVLQVKSKSWGDALDRSGFKPISTRVGDLASNKKRLGRMLIDKANRRGR
jgi:predicted transcriptional regulator